jgi:peptidoglycan/xylan/chitin deacetylase (PgdA/CDA1 family)
MPFVICYHRVVKNFDHSARHSIPSMLISTAMLERHIDWLAWRYSLVSVDEVGAYLESPSSSGKPPAAITFDDGYSDVYYNALPLLKRKGVPAAVFVVTNLVSTGQPQLFDRLYLVLHDLHSRGVPIIKAINDACQSLSIDVRDLQREMLSNEHPFEMVGILLNGLPHKEVEKVVTALENDSRHSRSPLEEIRPLSWEMIAQMSREGVTIGSHTKAHALLTVENLATVRDQLRGSRMALEAKLHEPVHHFAYPDGRFNAAVVREAHLAGYWYGFGICPTRDRKFPLLTIPRKVLWERSCLNALGQFSPAVMNCHANRVFDRGRCTEHDHRTIQSVEQYANVT